MKRRLLKQIICGLFLITCTIGNAQEVSFKIIINSENPTSALTRKEISKIFLKKSTKWKNSEQIIPVDQSDNEAVREKFTRKIHGKSINAIKTYWKKQIFSGRSTPPSEQDSDIKVLKFVQQNKNAIGYVSEATKLKGFKVKKLRIKIEFR